MSARKEAVSMKNRTAISILVSLLVLTCSSDLRSFVTYSQIHPKVLGKFNRLPSKTLQYPGPWPGGEFGPEGEFFGEEGIIESCDYDWDSECMKFFRRFDGLVVRMSHTMSYTAEYVDSVARLTGESLNHYFFLEDPLHHYDHNTAHGGSFQELLGKSKGGLIMMEWPHQEIISSFDIFNINKDHFEADDDNAQRELVDWLSPGWFALGVGDELDSVFNPAGNYTWITIQHPDSLDNFQHDCWKNDNPSDTAACLGYAHDNTYVMVLPPLEELEGMSLDSCKGSPRYEIMRVVAINQQYAKLGIERALFDTPQLTYSRGQEIRPIVWSNPKNWGDIAFFMNPTDTAPRAYIEGSGPYRFHDVGALFVANHHL